MPTHNRVLVTGGSGFVGRHLVAALRRTGVDVMAPTHEEYDLVDPAATRRMFADLNPDLVYHLAAACGGIGANRKRPGSFFHANMQMGINVLEQGHGTAIKTVLVGTVCSYPKHAPVPFREEDLWNGYPEETNAPYGIAKKALLAMAQAYREEWGVNAIMLLPANLYGPGDNFDLETSHVIPAMIRKFIEAQPGEPVTLWGDGSATRDFLYVEDCVQALIAAADQYDKPAPVNVGTGREMSMLELACLIRGLCESNAPVVWEGSMPNGQPRRVLDTTRAEEEFGFRASTTLEEGLAKTIAWYREWRDRL